MRHFRARNGKEPPPPAASPRRAAPAARPGRPRPPRPSLSARPRVARSPGTGAAAVGGRAAAALLTGERGGRRAGPSVPSAPLSVPGRRLGPAPRPPVTGRHLPGGRGGRSAGRTGPGDGQGRGGEGRGGEGRAGWRAAGGAGPECGAGRGAGGPGGVGGMGGGRAGVSGRAAPPSGPHCGGLALPSALGPGPPAGGAGRDGVTGTRKWGSCCSGCVWGAPVLLSVGWSRGGL